MNAALPITGRAEHAGARGGVLQVVLSLDAGGTERLVIELTRRVSREFRTTVCCLDRPGAWAGELLAERIEVVALDRREGFRPSIGLRLAAVARERAIGVLHCHQYTPFVYGCLALAASRGLGLVYTEHGRLSDAPPSRKRRLVNPWLGRFRCVTCAVSADLRRHMIAEGFSAARVQVVPNGIEPGPLPGLADRLEARVALGLPEDAFIVGTVARLDPVKDLMVLIDAMPLVRERVPTARLVVIGDGPAQPALKRRIEQLGLGAGVTMAGHRDDARALLPAFDLYANSSIHEGMSVTILEAMAAGLPVVATRVGGTPEILIDGESGVLVPARSPEALGAALATLALARDRARRLGSRGRSRLLECFSLDRMVETYAAVYRSVVGGTHVRD